MSELAAPEPRPCWIAGNPESGVETLLIRHPYDGSEVAEVAVPGADQIDRAIASAAAVYREFRSSPAHLRAAALDHVSRRLAEQAEDIAEIITAENGKPLKWAKIEVTRAVATFRFAAEEARRFSGELMRLDTDPAAENRLALVKRVPRGPVLGISPFNFPLNLVAHKVAPALAVGAPIIVKPAPRTPLSALMLGELLAETDLPAGAFSILPVGNAETMALVRDERLPVVSFTGSDKVGFSIMDTVPRKHVVLELGGNAAAVICADWCSPEDIAFAAKRIATFGNYQAGQSCIAVQRVLIDKSLYSDFVPQLLKEITQLNTGSPHDPDVEVGPLVDEQAAERILDWVNEAVAAGAKALTAIQRTGTSIAPIVLSDVPHNTKIWREEVFGPVLALSAVDNFSAAIEQVNDSTFGLQAGIFTHDVSTAFRAAADIEVGGIVIGDVPSYRADQQPYGGVKNSGVGREGVRSAMHDFTEEKAVIFTNAPW